jgi:hypothetical protein
VQDEESNGWMQEIHNSGSAQKTTPVDILYDKEREGL